MTRKKNVSMIIPIIASVCIIAFGVYLFFVPETATVWKYQLGTAYLETETVYPFRLYGIVLIVVASIALITLYLKRK